MEAVLIILAVFSVPLFAIGSRAWLKSKQIEANTGANPAVARRLDSLEADNRALRARVENLETIVTTTDVTAMSDFDRELADAARALPPREDSIDLKAALETDVPARK